MASTKVAVIDDWQNAAPDLIDWSPLKQRAEVKFFQRHFGPGEESIAAEMLADFDIILILRERSRFSEALIARLSQVAVHEGLSINSGLVGRVPSAVGPLCNARFNEPVAADTVYVVDPNSMSDFHGAHCGALEGVPVCVAAGTVLAQRLTAVVP